MSCRGGVMGGAGASAGVVVAIVLGASGAMSAARAQDVSFGNRLFPRQGRLPILPRSRTATGAAIRAQPGRAANLHETILTRDQMIEVIACGRPGTEMQHFDKYAYEDTDCYGPQGQGTRRPTRRAIRIRRRLTRREIEAVDGLRYQERLVERK